MAGFSWISRVLVAAGFLVGGSASAGPFAGGSFGFRLGTLPELAVPITGGFTTSAGAVTATSTGAITGTDVVGLTNAPPISRLSMVVTGNQTGTLVPGAGTPANSLALRGVVPAAGFPSGLAITSLPGP